MRADQGTRPSIVARKPSRRVGLRYFSYCALWSVAMARVCCFMPKSKACRVPGAALDQRCLSIFPSPRTSCSTGLVLCFLTADLSRPCPDRVKVN